MKKYILFAAAAIALVACNNEENYIDEPVAAQISATIGESPLSRASDITWDEGDIIGIFMDDRYTNMEFVTEKGDGMFTGTTMYFKNKQEPVTITGYYPYTGIQGQTPAVLETSTAAERQTAAEQLKFDFLYAVKENVTGSTPNVNLSFSHKMSKLTLTFKKGNAGTDLSKITSYRIDGLVVEGSFNPSTGVCAANTGTPATALNGTPTMSDDEAHLSLILFPQTVDKVMLKLFDSDNQEYGCELKFDGNRLESGNNYKFTINVKKTALNIENYSIVEWTEREGIYEAVSE